MNHITIRPAFEAGYVLHFGVQATLVELQFAQAVSWAESHYGQWWVGDGAGSNNLGCIQCRGKPPCDPAKCFLYGDTSPLDDGTSRAYMACFKKYPTLVEGAADLCNELYTRRPNVWKAVKKGDVLEAVLDMALSTYYQGYGATPRERVNNYFVPVYAALVKITTDLGEMMPDGTTPPRTLRLEHPFMAGDDVKRVQRIAGCRPDGQFGPITEKAVKAYQTRMGGLGADGIVGGYTWANVVLCELGRK